MMISLRKLIATTKKWHKVAAVSMPLKTRHVAHKGHFVVYTLDETRFVIPLAYLSSGLFRELLKVSEEEFGLPSDGPITLPCDSAFMECVVSVAQRQLSDEEVELDLLVSLVTASSHCNSTAKSCISHGLRQLTIQYGF